MSENKNTESENNNFDQPIAGHDYDGIQEFDNPLPMWWLWTFLGTIIFAFIYYIHYEFKVGPSLDQELSSEMESINKLKANSNSHLPEINLNSFIKDETKVSAGAVIYKSKCLACHGDKGQGLVGPNLTDKAWIHGSSIEEIYNTISKGVLDKGMPPWGDGVLKTQELENLTLFVYSLKGTNVPGGKAPEGTEQP